MCLISKAFSSLRQSLNLEYACRLSNNYYFNLPHSKIHLSISILIYAFTIYNFPYSSICFWQLMLTSCKRLFISAIISMVLLLSSELVVFNLSFKSLLSSITSNNSSSLNMHYPSKIIFYSISSFFWDRSSSSFILFITAPPLICSNCFSR